MLIHSPRTYKLVRPLFFALPPEAAQRAAHLALKPTPLWRAVGSMIGVVDEALNTTLCGITLRNPIGLAAGFDKNCKMLPSLSALGFGYLVGGTVTLGSGNGNPRPRMIRRTSEESLVNSLGFPGRGLDWVAARLERSPKSRGSAPLVLSVSGTTVEEIVACHRRLEPLADAVEVNISSPNTAGLRVFHETAALAELVDRINERRDKPLAVKLPPYSASDVEDAEVAERMTLVEACIDGGVEGVTVANSRPVSEPRLAVGQGGLSGRAIFDASLRMVADVRREAGPDIAINACGGISTGEDAWRALKAGATTVQLYTSMLYRGPGVVNYINRGLLQAMAADGVGSLQGLASSTGAP